MPLPLILGVVAAVAGTGGLGAAAYGASEMHDANKTMDRAREIYDASTAKLEEENRKSCTVMDELGLFELEVLQSFEAFSDVIARIQNRPSFARIEEEEVELPEYTPEELKEASVGAAVLLGGLSGAGLGVAGGVAASGATTAAVTALASASTGTAIASLSGAAATNATLAVLGGGTLAAGGGGAALGSMILGASTLGVGLLVGGAIFAVTGSKLSDKADKALQQAHDIEKKAGETCQRLADIGGTGRLFLDSMRLVHGHYQKELKRLAAVVDRTDDWFSFTEEEQLVTRNTVQLVGLLYSMCKVKLTVADAAREEVNVVNHAEVDATTDKVRQMLTRMGLETEKKPEINAENCKIENILSRMGF